jgi:hypothetical protein
MTEMNNSIEQVTHLVMRSAGKLDEFLADILSNHGGRDILSKDVDIFDIHNFNGFSGYNYWVNGNLVGQLHMATLQACGYVLYKRTFNEDGIIEIYDYYNQEGDFVYSANQLDGQTIMYESINMDPTSPFTNHLYNILNAEYEQATSGLSRTKLVYNIEETLRNIMAKSELPLSARAGAKDLALRNILNEIHHTEIDPVLRWEERQAIYKNLKEIRRKIINTKQRVHRFSGSSYGANVMAQDMKTRITLLKKRPMDNIKGFLYKNTIGNLLWFLHTVKDNLGYSVALAIYGPFTFYFITQPMNPHAMWAVGKVRNAYIQATTAFEEVLEGKTQQQIVAEEKNYQDQVSTQQSAVAKKVTVSPMALTKAPKVDWNTRMGDFKAMQIALEANMVFAERMGRIEQMENQYSFALTAESAWNEIERYITQIQNDMGYFKNLDSRYRQFLQRELNRSIKTQEYIWRKMAQFFLDHPYIVVDEEKKQTQRDYYVGRAFIFMNEMTTKLSKLNPEVIPASHSKINELAAFYAQTRKEGNSVMESLKQNSKLFSQKDLYSSEELRDYMKRHWEVLFIQQNKKQEASSFGLQAYTWSVKNAIWILQSVYSAKRDDIRNLTYKFNLDNQKTAKVKPGKRISMQYEHLFHMLTMEYVSLKKEFANNLRGDTEAAQREAIIESIKNFLIERDKLYNAVLQVANKYDTPTTRI